MAVNKKRNYLKIIPGQGVKTHDIIKGISFKDKVFKRTALYGSKAKVAAQKAYGKVGRSYKKYGKPTEILFRKTGAAALGVGKFALKRGALGFPGLAATGLYYGAKAIAGKQKGLKFPTHRQFDRRGRKII